MVNVAACIIDRVLDASECGVNGDCFVSCAKFPCEKCCFANLCTGVKVITLFPTSLSRVLRWMSRESVSMDRVENRPPARTLPCQPLDKETKC